MSRYFEVLQRMDIQNQAAAAAPSEAAEAIGPAAARREVVNPVRIRAQLLDSPDTRDEIVKLVQRLFLSGATHAVTFAGMETGDGCTSVTLAVADVLLADRASSVCIIDGNVRDPQLADLLPNRDEAGLADCLARDTISVSDFVQRPGGGNLYVLPAGTREARKHVVFTSESLALCLAELRRSFTYVLIDAPPLGEAHDGSVLARFLDGLVIVLKANSTKRENTRRAIQDMQYANVRVLGAVLNRRTFPIPKIVYDHV